MTQHRNPYAWLWRIEVGFRAALYTEVLPRDLRWWRGLWEKTRRERR